VVSFIVFFSILLPSSFSVQVGSSCRPPLFEEKTGYAVFSSIPFVLQGFLSFSILHFPPARRCRSLVDAVTRRKKSRSLLFTFCVILRDLSFPFCVELPPFFPFRFRWWFIFPIIEDSILGCDHGVLSHSRQLRLLIPPLPNDFFFFLLLLLYLLIRLRAAVPRFLASFFFVRARQNAIVAIVSPLLSPPSPSTSKRRALSPATFLFFQKRRRYVLGSSLARSFGGS